jgi:hypothetical protein
MALITRSFNGAQSFYVDPSSVDGQRTCDISAIDLYFKFKPDIILNTNDGARPSVIVSIAETMFDTPRITRESGIFTGVVARVPMSGVLTSSDATVPTTFRFSRPVTIETDKTYCFIIEYTLLGQYELWTSVQGEVLTGSTSISPGPSDKFIGRYFDFNTVFAADDTTNLDEYIKSWRHKTDTSLKFSVNIARYSHGGVPVSSNGTIDADDVIRTRPSAAVTANSTGRNFNVNFGSYEFISFDENRSDRSAFVGGQMAFQNNVFYPGGWAGGASSVDLTTVSGNSTITANTLLPDGTNFSWNTIFPAINSMNRIVITDNTTYNVRNVQTIVSDTVITVTEDVTFSNTASKIMITPTARVSSINRSSPFGIDAAFIMFGNSASNSTVRFVNNQITAATIVAGGTGYSNADVFYVTGFENVSGAVSGGYVAVANIVTDGAGAITSLPFSNLGAGFVNTAAILVAVANSTQIGNISGNTSVGTGATFTYTIGADIKTEYGNTTLRDCEVRNIDMGEFVPYHRIETPPGVQYSLKLETNYIKKANTLTHDGFGYYVNDGTSNNQMSVIMYDLNSTEYLEEIPVIPSKSNEFHLQYEDTSVNDKVSNTSIDSSQSLVLVTDISSNSDWATVRMGRPSVQFSKYIINNDSTNEHTDSGNAFARGQLKPVDFKRTSEDIRVFATCYKPANTDIKVYARVYKNEDPEAFDDKNWTELELKDGIGLISSQADPLDYVELEYGFYQIPQDRTPLGGGVQLITANNWVIGSGTDFVTDLAVGDLVYLYQPLFVENHMITSVESITNTSVFIMDSTTANTSILAEGMNIEKITYPEQAFNNKQNDNVVRYYNSATSKFDGYEHIAVKIVFLSPSPHKIPRVDDIKITAVSA